MSAVQVNSTTDTTEAVTAALGDLAKKETVVEQKSEADAKAPVETAEKSDAHEENVSHEADADESDEGDESQSKDGEKPKKKNGFKKRIDKLNQRLLEKDRETEYWRNEAEKSRVSREQKPEFAAKKETALDSDGKPQSDQFDSHAQYVEALADWTFEQREKAKEAKEKESQAKTEFEKKANSHIERVKSFKKTVEDFDDAVQEVDDIQMSQTVRQVILDSDNGPELMYALAKNRDEFDRICKLSPIAAARELGRFESKFVKASESSEKKSAVTKAPTPIKPVGSKVAAPTKSPDEMSYQEFKKWREAGGGA